jgi:DNA polymerase-1
MLDFETYLALPNDDPVKVKAAKLKTIIDATERAEELRGYLEDAGIALHYVTDHMQLTAAIRHANQGGIAGADLETAKREEYGGHPGAGLQPEVSRVRLVSLCVDRDVYVIDCFEVGYEWLPELKAKLVFHNAAFDLAHLYHYDGIRRDFECTMLLDRVMHGQNRSLAEVALDQLGLKVGKQLQVSDWSRPQLFQQQVEYAALDAVVAAMIHEPLREAAESWGVDRAYGMLRDLVYPVLRQRPIKVDFEAHAAWCAAYEKQEAECAAACAELGIANLNSSPQKQAFLEKVLTPDQMLDWPLTETGKLSTSREHLLAFRHVTGLEALAGYAEASHLLSNFGPKLKAMAVDGCISPSFHIGGASSGRFTCTHPNFQNLPRGDFKSLIIAGEGRTFACADYSQIELRVAADFAQEEVMLEAFASGRDLHAFIGEEGARLISREDLKPRQLGKSLNFGLLYGGGARMLVDFASGTYGVKIDLQDAQQLRDLFFRSYPALAKWQDQAIYDARSWGFTVTRYFGIKNTVEMDVYSRALNLPIQGTAAEILAIALMKLDRALPGGWALSHHVHDEIVIVGPEDTAAEAVTIMERCMSEAFTTVLPNSPIKGLVEVHIGQTWKAAKG